MMEGFGEIMMLEETAKYLKIGKSALYLSAVAQAGKMAREGRIPDMRIELGRDNKIIIRVPLQRIFWKAGLI